ncbi:hypothetical protein QR680_018960 [Steinernema hermaphroditum]|uniref:Uncharacterized protein n=1 Tax=Steinernema hermaphroditum TaxID=289476 RepID=A0AA39HJJ2_9BILA|nr:hypothetical protein QR680_018960 [Steinernema hermaphroditum]
MSEMDVVHGVLFSFSVLLLSSFVFVCGKKRPPKMEPSKGSADSMRVVPQAALPGTNADSPKVSNSPENTPKASPSQATPVKSPQQAPFASKTSVMFDAKTNDGKKASLAITKRTQPTQADSEILLKTGEKKVEVKPKISEGKEKPVQGPFGAHLNPSLRVSKKPRRQKKSREKVETTQESMKPTSVLSTGKSSRVAGSQEESMQDDTMDGVKDIDEDKVASDTPDEITRTQTTACM